MSGYRVFSRKFVKTIPISSCGFEVETEITLHSLDKRFLIKEISIEYRDRPEGSFSKLSTVSDGIKVLKTIFSVFKNYKPIVFFTFISAIFFLASAIIGGVVIYEFFQTSLVTKMPSAMLSAGLMIIAIISLFSGFILDAIVKQHKENYELFLNNSRI